MNHLQRICIWHFWSRSCLWSWATGFVVLAWRPRQCHDSLWCVFLFLIYIHFESRRKYLKHKICSSSSVKTSKGRLQACMHHKGYSLRCISNPWMQYDAAFQWQACRKCRIFGISFLNSWGLLLVFFFKPPPVRRFDELREEIVWRRKIYCSQFSGVWCDWDLVIFLRFSQFFNLG